MKYLAILIVIFLVGCDTLQGLRVPVKPGYEGSWSCVVDKLGTIGTEGKIDNANQLSVSDASSKEYLFTVTPNHDGVMELYFMQMHSPPGCAETMNSFSKIQKFINLMELHCGYKAKNYSASMQCGSNN